VDFDLAAGISMRPVLQVSVLVVAELWLGENKHVMLFQRSSAQSYKIHEKHIIEKAVWAAEIVRCGVRIVE
jgi:hypothetical protein